MKRTSLIAGLTGVVLLIAGCGSTSGTATAGSSVSSSAPAAASSGVVPPPLTSGAASSAPSSEASSSAPMSSASSGAADSGSSSAPDSGSADSSAPATTVGDSNGTLDPQTVKWFDTFCTGFGSLKDLQNLSSAMTGSGDPAAAQKSVVELFDKIGGTFTGTSAALKDLPPPTFTGGADFAAKIVPALATFGAALTDAGKKAAAVDVTKDPSGLATAMSGVASQMTSISSSFGELQNLKVTPQTQAAVQAIPSCSKLGSLGG